MSSEAVTDDECVGKSTNRYKTPCAPDHLMGRWGCSQAEQAYPASSPPSAVTDPSGLMSIEADILKSSSPAKPVHCGAASSVKRLQAKVHHKPKWHALPSVARRGDLCLRPNVAHMVRDWCTEHEIHIEASPLGPCAINRFTGIQGAFVQGVGRLNLVSVATHGDVPKSGQKSEGCKGFMLLPTRKQHELSWMMGEITIDWVDIPPTSEILLKPRTPSPFVHSGASRIC